LPDRGRYDRLANEGTNFAVIDGNTTGEPSAIESGKHLRAQVAINPQSPIDLSQGFA
jgi:hypothetical protein